LSTWLPSGDPAARQRFVVALATALLLHVALFAGLSDWSRVHPFAPAPPSPIMQLRLIDAPVPPPLAEPEPVPSRAHSAAAPRVRSGPQQPSRPTHANIPAQRDVQPTVEDVASMPAASAATGRLFNRDGTIDLPTAPADADPAAFGSRKQVAPYTPDPMVHQSPLPYVPTLFERDWKPRDETLLDQWVRSATVTRTWDTRGGNRISCSVFLFIGGCGFGWAPRVTIEELRRMRADPPMPRPSPLLPAPGGP